MDEKDNVKSYYHNGELLFDEIESAMYKDPKKYENKVINTMVYRMMYVHH